MRPLPSREDVARRLARVFPREAFDTVASNPQAAAAVAAMLYVDAVVPGVGEVPETARWARPGHLPVDVRRRLPAQRRGVAPAVGEG